MAVPQQAVIQKIKGITGNSLNVQVDYYQLKSDIPELSDDEVTDTLLYLEEEGLIKADNKSSYHGKTMIKNFRITSAFINKYPLP